MLPEPTPLHEVSTIETPEQIAVDLPLAGIGSRALAYIVDILIQAIPIVVAAVAAVAVFELELGGLVQTDAESGEPGISLMFVVVISAVTFAVNFGYFVLFEMTWAGQSPGKRALGIRVVRDGGYPLDATSALVRNLLRVVDFLPGFYLAGMLVLFFGGHGKRVGDYAAGTAVIKERKLEDVVVDLRPLASSGSSGSITAEERELVVQFLSRRMQLEGAARDRLAHELARRLAAKQGKPAPVMPEVFLEELLRS
ncbi:MAG: RDD family protein [Pseudomonadota bacterium]